jgi:Type IV secretion-system coupling protein DNA-binding domain
MSGSRLGALIFRSMKTGRENTAGRFAVRIALRDLLLVAVAAKLPISCGCPTEGKIRACMDADQVTRFARVDFHSDRRIFGIKNEDRLLHIYVIGKTGTGKSTLLENMALQDLERGHGFALIDPHGDLVARIAARVLCRGDMTSSIWTLPIQANRTATILCAMSGCGFRRLRTVIPIDCGQ